MRIELSPDADVAAAVRGTAGDSLVVVIAPGRDPLAQALAEAAIAPLAVERAPGMRVNAVVAGSEADLSAVDAAVVFLDQATSTTGQMLRVS